MRRAIAIELVLGSIMALSGIAHADVAACAAAAEQGQDLARAGKVKEAKDAFRRCTATDCPDLIAHDCAGFLASAESRIASASVTVTDAHGAKLPTAVVEMDGSAIDWTSASAIRVDPGVHTFVVRNDGDVTVERRVEFAEGSTVAVGVEMMPVLAEPQPSPMPPRRKSKPLFAGSLATSGVAVAGFALFAGFGEAGLSQQSELRAQCAPHCTSSQVDPVSTKFMVANVSLIVGVVATLGATALWYLYARSDHEAPPITSSR